ncbi:hypothetical protein [Mucilaginibacter auburnensis]|uniref:Lipoprotein n=1 Tax=Mucilaginibacter auburnensis TaxID=1457233 RepID=A0A2H9VVR0_9SPHI|nr:hypothetical protein [Mucilaginibacter auburnensis]PJJ84914.1 hypothetical protein CLV57_1936 [Mucilaginibacter auburnensis]
MKALEKATLILTTAATLFFTACDPERNKASLGDSADTLHTDNAKHKYEDGTMQISDSTRTDSGKSKGTEQADPSGRVNKQ